MPKDKRPKKLEAEELEKRVAPFGDISGTTEGETVDPDLTDSKRPEHPPRREQP